MGIVRKQGVNITLVSFLGVIIGAINTMFVFPNVLGAEGHGLVMLILSIATVLAQFAHLGIPNTIIRFFPYLKDRKKFIYRLALQVPLMSVLFLGLVFYIFGDYLFDGYIRKNELFSEFQPIILPLVASLVFFEVLLSISRSELKSVFPAVLREFILRLSTLVTLCMYSFNFLSFSEFVYCWLGLYSLNVLFLSIYLFRFKLLNISFGFPLFPNSDIARKMSKYGLVTLLTSSAAILVNRIDVLMLGYYLELENIAFYTVAFFMASLIHIPARSILQIVKPLLAKAWAENNMQEIVNLYRKTALNQLIIGLLLFIGVWMNINDLLLFVPVKYQGIQMVFFYIGLSKLIDVSVGVNGAIISTSNYYKYDLYINMVLILIVIITNITFIPLYGIVGAAMATSLAILIHNIIKTSVLYFLFRIHPFQLNTLKVTLLSVLIYYVLNLIPFTLIDSNILRVIVRSVCIVLVYSFVIIRFNLSDDINQLLKKLIRR
ncbi:MAG: polysaccharide biosynthesis C-terminal domain-containing protein [Flavobacteriales bacterium]|jgi:O-antigen/teichoic acid export membrane protein|tara:strand:- start:1046 stop:2515 length:1470 start_codon:yes stop_codon:yes gene_type:complete